MTYDIDLSFAQTEENTQQYPAIQADNYQPKLKDSIKLCLNDKSYSLLTDDAITKLKSTAYETEFGGNVTTVFSLPESARWIVLFKPQTFAYQKSSNEYLRIEKGTKFKENGLVSACKLHLCCVVDGDLILDRDGNPQVFTFNLKSLKTQIVDKMGSDKSGTLVGYNETIKKAVKSNGWLLHLFSLSLTAYPDKFVSKINGESSVACNFKMEDPKPLTKPQQKAINDLITTNKELRESFKDPYGINRQKQPEQSTINPQDAIADLYPDDGSILF